MVEKTLAIIKPDAVDRNITGKIIDVIEQNGFSIVRMQKMHLTKKQVESFYAIHKERPFFNEMVATMTTGPVVVMVLEKENAIQAWRDLMGATDPKKAAPGTIRKLFGVDIGKNSTHGSDSPQTAMIEIQQFFPELV